LDCANATLKAKYAKAESDNQRSEQRVKKAKAMLHDLQTGIHPSTAQNKATLAIAKNNLHKEQLNLKQIKLEMW